MNLSDYVEERMMNLGATPEYTGYKYLVSAVCLCIHDEDMLTRVTTQLYPIIAEKYQTNSANVERGIRTVISVIWCDADKSALRQLLGKGYNTQPGNAKFIAVASRKLVMEFRRDRLTEWTEHELMSTQLK